MKDCYGYVNSAQIGIFLIISMSVTLDTGMDPETSDDRSSWSESLQM